MAESRYQVIQKYSNNKLPTLPELPGTPSYPGFPGMPGIKVSSVYNTRPYLPNIPKLPEHYWTHKYIPPTYDKTPSTSYLVDYNDPTQINSLRDIILGTGNPNMQHSKMFGDIIDDIPILNIIPDSLQYAYDRIWKPTFKGQFKDAGINMLLNVAETLDVLANPIKGAVIAMYHGEDPLKAIQRATVGDETGIHNYDYDTGNFLTDLTLEIVSDPLNWVSFGGKGLVSSTAKSAGKSALKEGGEAALEQFTKEIAQELSEQSTKKISKEVIEQTVETYTNKASRELAQDVLSRYTKEQIVEGVETAMQKALRKSTTNSILPGTRSTLVKGLLRNNISDDLLAASDKKFLKVFTKNLNKQFGTDAASLISESVVRGMRKTVQDINHAVLIKVSSSITGSLGLKGIALEDFATKSLLKGSLMLSGTYPIIAMAKSKPMKELFEVMILRRLNDVVSNAYLTGGSTFLKAGPQNGYIQVANKEIELRLLFPELAEAQDPQQAIAAISAYLSKDLESIKQILNNNNIPSSSKRELINTVLQKLDSYHKINSIDDYIIKLEDLSEVTKKFDQEVLNTSGFENLLTEFYGVRKALQQIDYIDEAKVGIRSLGNTVETAKAIDNLDVLKVFDNYSVKDILKAIDNQALLDTVQNIPMRRLDNIIAQYQRAVAGYATDAEIQQLQRYIQKTFAMPHRALQNMSGLNDANVKYLANNMNQVLNKMFTPSRHSLRPAIVNNLQNIKNRLESLDSVFTLNKINPELYENTVLIHREVLGTPVSEVNVNLIETLKKFEDYTPNPEIPFKESELYKWAKNINQQYNNLQDVIDSNKKFVDVVSQEVDVAAFKDGMSRVEELQKASEEIVKSNQKLATTSVEFYDYISKISDKKSILSTTNIKKVYDAIDTLESASESLKRLHIYNEFMFEATKEHLTEFMNLIETIQKYQDKYTFEASYNMLRAQHSLLMTDFRNLSTIIDSKNVWDLKNAGLDSIDLSGVGRAVSRGNFEKPKFSKELTEAYDIFKEVQNTLEEIDFNTIELKEIATQFDTDIYIAKLDNMRVTNMLNNNEALQRLYKNSQLVQFIEHVPDMDSAVFAPYYAKFSEDDKYLLRLMYIKKHGIENLNRLQANINAWYNSLPASQKPAYVNMKNALITTLANHRAKDVMDINDYMFTRDFLQHAQGYIVGSDPMLKKYNVDDLVKQYNISDSDILQEFEHLEDIDKNALKRHNALYDTVAQIKIVEARTKTNYYGMMLDIETTGTGIESNAKLTEISLVRRNPDTDKIEILFNKKVQVPEDIAKASYGVLPDYMYKSGISEEAYFKSIIDNSQNYNEEVLLRDFYNVFAKQEAGMDLMTHNGDTFDIPFLQKKLTDYNIDNELKPFSKVRKLRNMVFKYEELDTVPLFSTLLNKYNVRDNLQEMSKNRFKINPKQEVQIQQMLSEYLTAQRKLEPQAKLLGRSTRFIEGVDSDFLREIRGLYEIDNIMNADISLDDMFKQEQLYDELASIDIFDTNDITKNLEISDIIKNKKLDSTVMKSTLSPEIREMAHDFFMTSTDNLRDVGLLNTAFRNNPFTDELFKNSDKLKLIKENIAKLLPDNSEIKEVFLNADIQNLSQLLYIGADYDPLVGYRRIQGSMWTLLDLDNIKINQYNINNAAKYASQIKKVNDSLYNIRDLLPQKDNIYNMLTDIKNTNIILEATISKANSENLQFTYAQLEVLWHKLKYRVANGHDTQFASKAIVKDMYKKYPELTNLLDNNVLHYKVHTGTDVLRVENTASDFNYPEFLKFQKAVELSGDAKSILNMQLNALEKVKTLRRTAEYKLKAMNTLHLMSNEVVRLDEMYNNTFVNGLPTSATMEYIKTGRRINEVLTAWETSQFLKLTPEQIRDKVINTGRMHSITLKKPSNKYFNNTELFDQFSMNKKELKKLGVTWEWNEETQRLTLGIDDDLAKRIKINKNVLTRTNHYVDGQLVLGTHYTLDGVAVPQILLEEIDEQVFKSLITGPKEYINQMWVVRSGLLEMNPELSGRWGLVNYVNTYTSAKDNPIIPKFAKNELERTEDFLAYFNDWNLGEFDSRAELVSGLNTDYRHQLNLLSRKMLDHSHAYLEYGQFIMQGGIRLDSKELKKMSLKEIGNMLETNRDYVAIYLTDSKYAIGGYELRKINTYTENVLKEAERLGAVIVPWDIYEIASQAINQFSYQNKFVQYWNKIMQGFKRSWLVSIGTILRNAMDSTMKNFAEGDSPVGVMADYVRASDLLYKFDIASREIKKLDPWGRFRLGNADLYFSLPNAKLDKETYNFLYDFMQNNGTNSVASEIDGIFGVLTKPYNWIERNARLTQYLNLEGQGYAYSEIMRRITETHFNYSTKTYAQFVAQNFIPFYTYVTSNINYLVHLLNENPSFVRNFFNVYTPIWDFDSYDYEELAGNASLQYQIINGNIPLEKLFGMFGYKDKQVTKIIDTKYGPKEQVVTNTAVLKMGSSVLDAFMFLSNPVHNIKEKLAPPLQLMANQMLAYSPLGNVEASEYTNYQENYARYQSSFGGTNIQDLFKDPKNLLALTPGLAGLIPNKTISSLVGLGLEYNNKFKQSKVYERTQNELLSSMPSVFGATARWGEFVPKEQSRTPSNIFKKSYKGYSRGYSKRSYSKRVYHHNIRTLNAYPGQGVTYRVYNGKLYPYITGYASRTYFSGRTPYSKYNVFLANVYSPNRAHRPVASSRSGNMQTIPQYLYSYMGKNRYGKSKLASWMNMNTRYKVKSTLRRLASP